MLLAVYVDLMLKVLLVKRIKTRFLLGLYSDIYTNTQNGGACTADLKRQHVCAHTGVCVTLVSGISSSVWEEKLCDVGIKWKQAYHE